MKSALYPLSLVALGVILYLVVAACVPPAKAAPSGGGADLYSVSDYGLNQLIDNVSATEIRDGGFQVPDTADAGIVFISVEFVSDCYDNTGASRGAVTLSAEYDGIQVGESMKDMRMLCKTVETPMVMHLTVPITDIAPDKVLTIRALAKEQDAIEVAAYNLAVLTCGNHRAIILP